MKRLLSIMFFSFMLIFDNTKTTAVSSALSVDDRVNEIVEQTIGSEYKESDTLNYIEAAICINKVAGLSDNSINHPLNSNIIWDVTEWSSKDVPRKYFIGDYLCAMGFVTVFQPRNDLGITMKEPRDFYTNWYSNMESLCQLKNAVELSVNCVEPHYDNYIETAKEKGLYHSIDMDNKNIQVNELKELMRNMYSIEKGVYYSSDIDEGISDSALQADIDMSYYERYCNRLDFCKTMFHDKGKSVSVMQNSFGAKLVGFRDFCEANGITVEWDNGRITISYDGEEQELHLDNFPDTVKIFVDKSIYAYHPIDEISIDMLNLDNSFSYFGQYEMINDSIYLYPKTFSAFIEYMGIETEITYETLLPNKPNYKVNIIEKDYNRMSDVEGIVVPISGALG